MELCGFDCSDSAKTQTSPLFCRTDTQAELELVRKLAKEGGAFDAVICNHWAEGGKGAVDLASAVDKACQAQSNFKFLYDVSVKISAFKTIHVYFIRG